MADLYNLLNEIDESQQNIQLDQDEAETETVLQSESEWISEHRRDLDVPPALAEAEQRRNLGVPPTPDLTTPSEPDRIDLEDFQNQLYGEEDGIAALQSSAYMKLRTLWSQEIRSPELLPYDHETMQFLKHSLQEQEDDIEQITTQGQTGNANMDSLLSSILKIDANRVKYLMCDILRQRLHKIEEHPLYMRQNVEQMSEHEVDYLQQYGTMLESHLQRTVLDHFPQDVWKKLDEAHMIDEPDLDTYVFVRVKETIYINNGTEHDADVQRHEKGSCLIVSYKRIRQLFMEDKLELLM